MSAPVLDSSPVWSLTRACRCERAGQQPELSSWIARALFAGTADAHGRLTLDRG